MPKRPKITIFAGPNSSGKSFIYNKYFSHISDINYINTDNICKQIVYFLFENTIQEKFVDLGQDYFELSSFKNPLFNLEEKEKEKSILKKQSELALHFNETKEESNKFSNIFYKVQEKEKFYHSLQSAEKDTYEHKLITGANLVAAKIGDDLKLDYINNKKDFVLETVMSSPKIFDHINLAKKKDFEIETFYITTNNPKINIQRTNERLLEGGHFVSPEKVKSRYFSSAKIFEEVMIMSDFVNINNTSTRSSHLSITNSIDEIDRVGKVCDFYIKNNFPKSLIESMEEKEGLLLKEKYHNKDERKEELENRQEKRVRDIEKQQEELKNKRECFAESKEDIGLIKKAQDSLRTRKFELISRQEFQKERVLDLNEMNKNQSLKNNFS